MNAPALVLISNAGHCETVRETHLRPLPPVAPKLLESLDRFPSRVFGLTPPTTMAARLLGVSTTAHSFRSTIQELKQSALSSHSAQLHQSRLSVALLLSCDARCWPTSSLSRRQLRQQRRRRRCVQFADPSQSFYIVSETAASENVQLSIYDEPEPATQLVPTPVPLQAEVAVVREHVQSAYRVAHERVYGAVGDWIKFESSVEGTHPRRLPCSDAMLTRKVQMKSRVSCPRTSSSTRR